jgi:predicted secreted protein
MMNLSAAHGRSVIKVNHIGHSPKGQYVAFEEFGYLLGNVPFVRVRVYNTWKNKYVTKPVRITGKDKDSSLSKIRQEAKRLANKDLQAFNISG